MKQLAKIAAASVIALGASTAGAFADQCSGHSHDTGTILGAGGGAVVGGFASHSAAGAVIGGVAGALAGNAIARNNDCRRYSYRDHYGHHHYYYSNRDYGRDGGYNRAYGGGYGH